MAVAIGHQRPRIVAAARAGSALALFGAVILLAGGGPAAAQRIENGKAVFAALDKVTARISRLEAKLGESVKFGALQVTARACYSRAPTEPPKTTSFVEIQERKLDGKLERIFSGWMFAESPGLNPVEHPVYDVWLTECAAPAASVATEPQAGGWSARSDGGEPPQDPPRRSRPRR